MDKISKIKKILNDSIQKINDKYIKRNSKISFKDVIYGLSLKSLNNYSYDKVVYELNKSRVSKFSKSGFINKSNYIDYKTIENINNNLLNYVYNDSKRRILSVDGSNLRNLKIFKKHDFRFSSNTENYTLSVIGGLYDVDKNIPINYTHSNILDERKIFKSQLKYIKKNDILLFDRGYYSKELNDILDNMNVFYIFRLKSTYNTVKHMINNNLKECIFNNTFKYKIINYKIYEEEYYVLTNLLEKDNEEIKELYKKRWNIEVHYKELKYTTSLKDSNSKNINTFLKEISIHNFIYILYYYFYDCIKQFINKDNTKYKINNKLTLEIFIKDILNILIYNKKYKKQVLDIINFFPITYIHKNDRHYERISKRKVSMWYIKKKKEK